MKDNTPILLVFAEPNGSGKSTITARFPIIGDYINADDIQRYLGCTDLEAAQKAEETREALLSLGRSFTFESLLFTPRNIDLMRRAHEAGYTVICIYVLTYRSNINVRRCQERLAKGGHGVPLEKVKPRYERAMKLIPQLFEVCDQLLIYDNSPDRSEGQPERIVTFEHGQLETHPTGIWSQEMIDCLLSGEYTGEPDEQTG